MAFTIQPRPYQRDAIAAVRATWNEHRSALLVLPTGTGKTIIFATLAAQDNVAGRRVLILAHRDELIRQAADKLAAATGLGCSIEKASERASDSFYMTTVASVQTLMQPHRLQAFAPDHFDTIIIDEAHHAITQSYTTIIDYFPAAKVLGVTATPDRGDKKTLATTFDALAYEYTLREAMAAGYLVPKILAQTVPIDVDLTKVHVRAGDFDARDLDSALDPYIPQIAAAIPPDRKTLVFTPLCATAQKLTTALRDAGRTAFYSAGDYRDEIPAWEAAGPGAVMSNAMLLNEGYDHPPVDCILVLRATKSRPFYAQMIGRGTRPLPHKNDLLLLDLLWHSTRHKLCHPASLIATDEDTADKITAATREPDAQGEQLDILDLEQEVRTHTMRDREAALAKELATHKHKRGRLIDPLAFAIATHDQELQAFEPTFKWQKTKPTQPQLDTLARFGIDTESITSRGFASALLSKLINRSKNDFARPKQISLLARFGIQTGPETTFARAKQLIDAIADNGWRRPSQLPPEAPPQ